MKILAEHEAKTLLARYDIPIPVFKTILSSDDLDAVSIPFPVALKVSSPEVLHKTDAGGVLLNIWNKDDLAHEYNELQKKFPGKTCIVEAMAPRGIECIAGIVDDITFGMCIMVGIGGIFTELYNDASFRMLPIISKDAEEMLEDLEARRIFHGYRVTVDRKALVSLLLKLSRMAEDLHIKQFDLNPIFLYEHGLTVVDAKGIIGE